MLLWAFTYTDKDWHERTHVEKETHTQNQHAHTHIYWIPLESNTKYTSTHSAWNAVACQSKETQGWKAFVSRQYSHFHIRHFVFRTQNVLCETENIYNTIIYFQQKKKRIYRIYYIASVVITVHRIRRAKAYTRSR